MVVDTLIVGAGLAGCSVAVQLAPHERVLVLEQGPQPGAEATSQNAGMVRRMGEDPWERALAMRTHTAMVELGLGRKTGALLALVRDPHHLHDAAAHLRARGVRVESLDRAAEVAPAMGNGNYQQLWWLPDELVADPHALLSHFLKTAKRHGAEIRCNAGVSALRMAGDRVVGVEVAGEFIAAGRVLLAAGAWSPQLARGAGLERPLFPLRRTLLQSAAHPLSKPDHPWCWVDDAGVYARPEAGGWLVSACDEAIDTPKPGPGSRGPVDPLHRALAHEKLNRWMPAISDLRFTTGWTGLRTFAPDRRPFLGADPDCDGLWWAAGLGGFGLTCSIAVGEAVAAWMRGETLRWISPQGVSPGRHLLSRWPVRTDGDLQNSTLVDTNTLLT